MPAKRKKLIEETIAGEIWIALSSRIRDKPEFLSREELFNKNEEELYTNLTKRFARDSAIPDSTNNTVSR